MDKTAFQDAIADAMDQPTEIKKRPRRCENCKFAEINTGAEPGDGQSGFECHRMPPRAQALLAQGRDGPRPVGTFASWPPVLADNWCGEWQPVIANLS